MQYFWIELSNRSNQRQTAFPSVDLLQPVLKGSPIARPPREAGFVNS